MKPEYLPTGSVVQVNPRAESVFAGCLFIVLKARTTIVDAGMVMLKSSPTDNPIVYVKLPYEEIEVVGTAPFPLGPMRDATLSEQQQFDLIQQQIAKVEGES